MKINKSLFVKNKVLSNLLYKHETLSKTGYGDVKEIIRLSKFLLKFSNKFNNELLELGFEQDDSCTKKPPNKREQKES